MIVKLLDKLEGFAFVLMIVLIANKDLTLALILLAIGGIAMLLETWKIEQQKKTDHRREA